MSRRSHLSLGSSKRYSRSDGLAGGWKKSSCAVKPSVEIEVTLAGT